MQLEEGAATGSHRIQKRHILRGVRRRAHTGMKQGGERHIAWISTLFPHFLFTRDNAAKRNQWYVNPNLYGSWL